jgi:hypothetical protein
MALRTRTLRLTFAASVDMLASVLLGDLELETIESKDP